MLKTLLNTGIPMLIGLLMGLFLFERPYNNFIATPSSAGPSKCSFENKLKPEDICNHDGDTMTFRQYDAMTSSPNQNYTLYGVKEGQQERAAVSNDEWKKIGSEKIPMCRIVGQPVVKAAFCWDEEEIQPMLIAYHPDGTIAIVAPNNYYEVNKGYRVVSIIKVKAK